MSLTRRAVRLAASVALGVPYVVGAAAAVVAVVAISLGTAVRLGWSDVKRRAAHASS